MNTIDLSKIQLQAIFNEITDKPNGVNELLELTINALMRAERAVFLDDNTHNKGNGYRQINGLGLGNGLTLKLLRDRRSNFKPYILEVMRQSQEGLNELFFELYAHGLTTRDIEKLSHSIYGQHLSKSQVSRITREFYDDMKAYRNRELKDEYVMIYLDATFIKTRRDSVASEAYYIVLGVKDDKTREIIGIYNAPNESSCVWEDILSDLKTRGVKSLNLFIIDDLTGLDSSIEQAYHGAHIQKCVLHLKRNILKKIRKKHREEVSEDLADIFAMNQYDDSKVAFYQRAKVFYTKWYKIYPELDIFVDEQRLSYYCRYLDYAVEIRRMIYTTNWIERLNKDFKRVIKIRNSMPNVDSVLTLLSKVAYEKNMTRYSYPINQLNMIHFLNNE